MIRIHPKVAKYGFHFLIGGISSAAIGQIIKAERSIEDKVEAHFDSKREESEEDSD